MNNNDNTIRTNTIEGPPRIPVPGDENNNRVQTPLISNDNVVDNPLLPRQGVPVTSDDFVDSSERILNGQDVNELRYDDSNNVWNVNQSKFYDDSGLAGIDTAQNSNRFDLGKFNIEFDRSKEKSKINQKLKDLEKLHTLSKEEEKISLYNLTIFQIIVNTKDAWFNLLDDLLNQNIEKNTFTKENRLFYIGVTIIIVTVILYIYTLIVTEDNNKDNNKNLKIIYHIYKSPPKNTI